MASASAVFLNNAEKINHGLATGLSANSLPGVLPNYPWHPRNPWLKNPCRFVDKLDSPCSLIHSAQEQNHSAITKMRRENQWKTKRDDGTRYEVRVGFFGGKFKFQFRESNATHWDYTRPPEREDLLMLLDVLQRKYQRKQTSQQELDEAERLLRESD